jgi:putative intracellular protease/amidase
MHRVGLIVPHGFQLLSLAPMTGFEMTGFGLAKPPPADSHYDLHLLSEHGGPVRSSCGLTVETEAFNDPAFDTIIVGAVTAFEMAPSSANLIAFVQEAAKVSRRTASFCNGAFVLAEAGLLAGRRATTHWIQATSFRARFPDVRMEEHRIYINDGPIWTSAGMTAGIDLVLAMIDRDLGSEVAKVAAKLYGHQSTSDGWTNAAFRAPRHDTEIRSHPIGRGVHPPKSAESAHNREPCGGRQPQSSPVQSRLSGRDGAITGKSSGAASAGNGQVHDGGRAAHSAMTKGRCKRQDQAAELPEVRYGKLIAVTMTYECPVSSSPVRHFIPPQH